MDLMQYTDRVAEVQNTLRGYRVEKKMITEYPLTKANRIQLARVFHSVARVDLALDCVIEGQMGKAYVDDLRQPQCYRVQVGPLFNYYAGDPTCPAGQEMILNISPYTLIMPSAEGWIEAIRDSCGSRLNELDRYSFSSNTLNIAHLNQLIEASPFKYRVKSMDEPFISKFWNQVEFLDFSGFDSGDDFVQRGAGVYLQEETNVVGSAYAALVCSRGIEISIFVQEAYRQQGLATCLAAHLLRWSLNNHLEPHWDAANPESCKLALKLGYKFLRSYLAYYINE